MPTNFSSKQPPFARELTESEIEFRHKLLKDVDKGESFEVIKTKHNVTDPEILDFLKQATTTMAGHQAVLEGQDPYQVARKLGLDNSQTSIQNLVIAAALLILRNGGNLKDVIKKYFITDDTILAFIKQAATNIAKHQVINEGQDPYQVARKIGVDDKETIGFLVSALAGEAVIKKFTKPTAK